jgi:hypothetical protein
MQEASDMMHKIGDSASGMAQKVGSRASDVAHRARDGASSAMHTMGTSPIARTTGKIPADVFLIAAAGSIVGSLVLKLMGNQKDADFVGHWAPTLVSLGLLSKLIEHDQHKSTTHSGGDGI